MANILQVTPNVNTDNRNMINPQDPKYNAGNPAVHNPADPTRVVRADGRDGQQGEGAQDALFSAVNYDSNYGAFIKGLGDGQALAGALERLLFTDLAGLKEAGGAEVGALIDKFLLSVQMDSPQELFEFLEGQRDLQARFTGGFFDEIRSLMEQNPSERLKDATLFFLKGYNDYSAGSHLLQQMRTLTGDIENLLLRSYRQEFRELANAMNWNAPNGETLQNTGVLNDQMIPFLSSYISKTHDYGPIREATMLLIFHAVRYENGNTDRLLKSFDNMVSDRNFARLFKGDAQASLENLLRAGARMMQRPGMEALTGRGQMPGWGAEGGQTAKALGEGQVAKELGEGQMAKELGEGQMAKELGEGQMAKELGEGQMAKELGEGQAAEELGEGQMAKELGEDQIAKELGKDQVAGRELEGTQEGKVLPGQEPKDERIAGREAFEKQVGRERPLPEQEAAKAGILKGPGQVQQPVKEFADGLAHLLLKGANGQAGLENVQQFYNIMNGMLINESVFMPLLHFILPFQYEDNNVISEMWVDPDAKREREDEPRKQKVFLKFDIQSLGKFELVMTMQEREARIQLYVPPSLAKKGKEIQTDVADILKNNRIRFSQLQVRERVRDRRVDEVFPEIREKERTINVRI